MYQIKELKKIKLWSKRLLKLLFNRIFLLTKFNYPPYFLNKLNCPQFYHTNYFNQIFSFTKFNNPQFFLTNLITLHFVSPIILIKYFLHQI